VNFSKLGLQSETFLLMTRVFAALRRQGRLVDMVYFQENAEYAINILAAADHLRDAEISNIVARLRSQLRPFLNSSLRPMAA
jgi:hypothetical protein